MKKNNSDQQALEVCTVFDKDIYNNALRKIYKREIIEIKNMPEDKINEEEIEMVKEKYYDIINR